MISDAAHEYQKKKIKEMKENGLKDLILNNPRAKERIAIKKIEEQIKRSKYD